MCNGARAISAFFAFLIVFWAILAGVLWAVLEVPKSAGSDFTCIARGIESAGESYYIGTKR
ncbi:MAG: hypothetical protein NUW37_19410, partial [Planctomycetes bacterium]|nr:hypothetical protein [Planctomycetota bacterium]